MSEMQGKQYTEELTVILELRDVPPDAIEQIVREVDSHTSDSGEDPVTAFGSPSEYADNFAPRSRMLRFWALIVSSVILASGGAYVLISGVFGLQSSAHSLWGLAPWARVVIGAAGIAAFVVLIVVAGIRSRRRARSWRI